MPSKNTYYSKDNPLNQNIVKKVEGKYVSELLLVYYLIRSEMTK